MTRFVAFMEAIDKAILLSDFKQSQTIGHYKIGGHCVYVQNALWGWNYFPRKALEKRPYSYEVHALNGGPELPSLCIYLDRGAKANFDFNTLAEMRSFANALNLQETRQ